MMNIRTSPLVLEGQLTTSLRIFVILHFLVLITHSAAHFYHKVYPDTAGTLIILFGYYALPAWGLLNLRKISVRSLLIMLAGISVAFAHGVIYHFILDTPDYVCYFGAHITGLWFTITAYGLAVVDFTIATLVVLLVIRMRRYS